MRDSPNLLVPPDVGTGVAALQAHDDRGCGDLSGLGKGEERSDSAEEKREVERISYHRETKPKLGRPEDGTRETVISEVKRAAREAGIDPVLDLSNTGRDFPWWAFI
jgi:hypothetical protein